MNVFFDNCVSYRLANMLAAFTRDHTVRHISNDERFAADAQDVTWLPTLARDAESWIVISGDSDIIDTPQERAMLIKCELTFFCMDHHWMKTKLEDQVWKFFKIWPEIEKYARNPMPALHRVRTGPGSRLDVEIIRQGDRARGGPFRSRPGSPG